MELLGKKGKWLFLSLALALMVKGYAQDYKAMQEAFSTSYTLEADGKYAEAVTTLKKVYSESSYEVNVRLGWLNYLTGNFVESVSYYNRSLKLMPYSVEARLGFVYPASSLGNWDQVITKYEEILRIDPSNYTANYRLGAIYYTRKEYQRSYKFFEKLVNMFPFDYDALHMFAWTNYRMGKFREAKVLFNKALLNRPGDASCTEGLSLIR